ncbi:unnamed protein product [Periconia digitata]|uniref:Uncharacterized protein n=1 Tax=Periconia digitata TaxID=1303443 RepID=A0A9W4XLM6_9PLEO|nr:unnamed protein product [Periconia digitata]
MPPSSSRRVGLRTRRDPDPQQQSDVDTPDSIATPSRKRRRVATPQHDQESDQRKGARIHSQLNTDTAEYHQSENTPRTRITESMASNDSDATLPNGNDADVPTEPIERQNLIINSLRAPQYYTPHAAIDYANDLQLRKMEGDNIAAFAKVAGRDWCFFVQKLRFIIGRSDVTFRTTPRGQPPVSEGLSHSDGATNEWGVDIDLGPERQISRVHAEINYDSTAETWYITVNSRNGLKLDDQTLQKGQRAALHSGICISIMSTQMVFLLAKEEDSFHPMLWRQVKIDREIDGSDDDDANPPNRALPHAHPNGPTPKREYDPFPPTSARQRAAAQALLTSTPGRPNPNTPMAFRSAEKHPRSQDSPATYPRGMMMDSTEDIDYSKDSAKDIKPPHSYAQLIGQAILSSPDEMLTLANIYDHIKSRYAFFRHTSAGWQNSIRHNLSLNKSFEKIARRTDEPGKGMKWKIADSEREDFVKKQMLNPRKGGGASFPLGTSAPSSPAIGHPSSQRDHREPLHASERLQGALNQDVFGKQNIKSPPRSATPPLSSIPVANQSFTPERGPRSQSNLKQSPTLRDRDRFVTPAKRLLFPDADDGRQPSFAKMAGAHRGLESSPTAEPVKQNVSGLRGEAANSPPPLYSDPPGNSAGGNQEAHRHSNALVTPLVSRHAPRLAPPSTAQVPSQYMNFSSPAPFWKFMDLPSTPARAPADLSPIKLRHNVDREAQDESVQPSSPPLIREDEPSDEPEEDKDDENKGEEDEDVGPESPSRTVSRPVSRQVGPHRSRSNSNMNGFEPKPVNGGMVRGASLGSFEEEPEEEGFDLSKGFQKIGSFHRNLAQAHGVVGRGS